MRIWILFLWSLYVPEFEAGQYQTYERCEAAAIVQTAVFNDVFGPGQPHWRCERKLLQTANEELR